MGIVTIPPGCMVQSKTGIIYGSTDKVATFKRRYAIMTTEVMDIPKDEAKQVPIELKHIVPIHDETDKVLQEAAQDLAALDTSTTWMWVAIALGNVMAIVITAIIGLYICKRCKTSPNTKQPIDAENEIIELVDMNQSQPTPVPAPRVWQQYVPSKKESNIKN